MTYLIDIPNTLIPYAENLRTRTGVGFRVHAIRADGAPLNCDLTAWYPNKIADVQSIYDHLGWHPHVRSPWLSIFKTWKYALAKARWYLTHANPGRRAAEVQIHVIDLEKVAVISATRFAPLLPPQWAGLFEHEVLIYQGIPQGLRNDIVITTFGVFQQVRSEVAVNLGVLTVPFETPYDSDVENQAWIGQFLKRRLEQRGTGYSDMPEVVRFMQALCTKRFD